MTAIVDLISEYRTNPLGIDVLQPRFGWQMRTDRPGARQIAYRMVAARTIQDLNTGNQVLWDSGKIASDQSFHIEYAGVALQSRQRVYWKVFVWDETDEMIESEPAWFEMGLLQADDWQAQWIGTSLSGGVRSMIPVPYLRKTFTLSHAVASARLYITSIGVLECSINGQPVSDDIFAPGWTDYRQRVQVLTYDVTSHLQAGENAIEAILGDGWAVGYLSWLGRQNYADRPQLLAQLEITFEDGSTTLIVSDDSWRYAFGPITHSDFLAGEAYDARKELPALDSADWQAVKLFEHPDLVLMAQTGPTVKRIQEIIPIADPVDRGNAGRSRWLFDLGQNMVGRVRFKGKAPAGTTIKLIFAEVLDADGAPYTANLRSAQATDYYTFKGADEEIWEPKFTFHGFRYVEIDGYPGEVSRETVTGIVLHSEMAQTGTFVCSEPLLNQLQSNILWGQKGNFLDVPTDCPQRDERLGWTGDIQVFIETAAFNMDVAGFMTRWAINVRDAQTSAGAVPSVVPYVAGVTDDGGPAWADAAIICPWTIYQSYADTRILEENYASMAQFMTFLIERSPGYIRCAPDYDGWLGYGDWLSINASTPRDLIGTAFLAYDASLMVKIATILGKVEDAAYYQQVWEHTRQAFADRFLIGSHVAPAKVESSALHRQMDAADHLSRGKLTQINYGEITSAVFNTALFTPTQTAYVLALHFNLLPDDLRPIAVNELVADLERRDMHLSTGFVGSPYLNHVLSSNGRLDIAYKLLLQKTWPSWLYAVTQGATTIWERWDGWTEENGFQTPDMNSFNHYAYGAIGAWLYSTVAGIQIDPAHPGYKHTILRPRPGGELTFARVSLRTLYGEIQSDWKLEANVFEYMVAIPPNTSATVYLPCEGHIIHNGAMVTGLVHKIESGNHRFTITS